MNITRASIALTISLASLGVAENSAGQQLQTDLQKFSYGIGLQIGQNLKAQGVGIDPAALSLAISDVLADKEPRVPIKELAAVMESKQRELIQKAKIQGDHNLAESNKFFAENKKKQGITAHASGLQYEVLSAGKGKQPKLSDTVTVHYKGTLLSGEEFDSSYKRGEPATFPLSGVIKGWQEALQEMQEGAKWRVFVPPTLAYGERGAGTKIGPNAALIFEIELLAVQDSAGKAE